MIVPLCRAKAELFRALGNPTRIRVLELLRDGPRPVRDLLADLEVDASALSQQLAVLRGAGLVNARRGGNTVQYALNTDAVAALLAAARQALTWMATGHEELLAQLRGGARGVMTLARVHRDPRRRIDVPRPLSP